MLPSFLLSLREGLEAALIIGIVLGVLYKIQRPDLKPVVWGGAISAIILSIAAAVLLKKLGAEFEDTAEEIFEGVAMLLAGGILTWMIFWMRSHADTFKTDLEANVHQATLRSGMGAIFILGFLSVAREGLELVLFLVAAQMTSDGLQTLLGALIGLGTAILIGWIIFATTRNLSLKRFFQVTNVLLILFAAGLVAHGIHEFNEAGIIPPIIDEDSISEDIKNVKEFEILIDEGGQYRVNGRALIDTRMRTLQAAIYKESSGDTTLPMIITADAQAAHQDVVRAMDAAGKMGFVHLSITTRQPANQSGRPGDG